MSASLPFARFVQLLKAIEQLPIPADLYNRYRSQYDCILGKLCISSSKGRLLTVAELSNCPILGSQPTANKRLQELMKYGLIESQEGEDRRQKVLTITPLGHRYLEACSEAMAKAIAKASVPIYEFPT
jgi:predicted transcriptional regulator